MKQTIQLVTISALIAVAESKVLQTPRHSMLRTLDTNACEQDNEVLGNVPELKTTMQEIEIAFDTYFEDDNWSNCETSKEGAVIYMDCIGDYRKFYDGYVTQCDKSGGKFYPVSMLMRCNGALDTGGTLELEMELMNVPSCFGKSCIVGEVYEALSGVLRATEASVSSANNNLTCNFFHNYDTLEGAPNTIRLQDIGQVAAATTTSDHVTFKVTGFALLIIGLGVLLTL
jgi:hypothetical protein